MIPGVDLSTAIQTGGLVLVGFIVFAETGLFVGFFLPGDSLLFTAGFLASQGKLDNAVPGGSAIWVLSILCAVAAIVGDSTGYAIGRAIGPRLFTREDSLWFHKKHLQSAHDFYERNGGRAIILAQFMPIVRTFSPVVAGIARMNYARFATYNVIAAAVWGFGFTWVGYAFGHYLGKVLPGIDNWIVGIVIVIVLVSIAPTAIHVWRENGDDIRGWLRSRRQ